MKWHPDKNQRNNNRRRKSSGSVRGVRSPTDQKRGVRPVQHGLRDGFGGGEGGGGFSQQHAQDIFAAFLTEAAAARGIEHGLIFPAPHMGGDSEAWGGDPFGGGMPQQRQDETTTGGTKLSFL